MHALHQEACHLIHRGQHLPSGKSQSQASVHFGVAVLKQLGEDGLQRHQLAAEFLEGKSNH